MMNNLFLAIAIWLAIGFLVAMKQLYIDRKYTETFWKEIQAEENWSDHELRFNKKKRWIILNTTLLGPFAFWADTQRAFGRKNK